ncbi:unnamed protein product [marine sediment metagenome]|uniref:Uncharacterized protein n=1 Tax=marine sediment metagenome TaxID=412755 RepID=X1M781_9ZZZZ
MEKTRRIFRFLADTFIEPSGATAGRILAALKEDPGYRKSLEDISQEDLVNETSDMSACEIAAVMKNTLKDYHTERFKELMSADDKE